MRCLCQTADISFLAIMQSASAGSPSRQSGTRGERRAAEGIPRHRPSARQYMRPFKVRRRFFVSDFCRKAMNRAVNREGCDNDDDSK